MLKINKLWAILTSTEKKNIYILFCMMVFGMVLELIGISSIIPLIILIFDQGNLLQSYYIVKLMSIFSLDVLQLISISFILIILIYFFKFIYLSFLTLKLNQFIFNLNADLSKRIFNKYLHMSLMFHIKKNSSELISNIIVEATKYSQQVVGPCLRLVSEFVVFIGIIFFLIYFEPFGTLLAISIFTLFSIFFILVSSKYITNWANVRILNDKLRIKHAQEGIEGIKEIKLDNAENDFVNQFNIPNKLALNAQARHTTLLEIPRYGIELIAVLSIILVISFFYMQNNSSDLLVVVAVFSASVFRILPSINKVIVAFQNLRFGVPVIEKLYEEMNLKSIDENIKNNQNPELVFYNKIIMRDISFSYINRKNNIFTNLFLEINKGECVGIFGDSGSGKSTLISLISGLIEPNSGSVLVDNLNVNTNPQSWRKKISYVSQRVFLLDDTIKNNILFGFNKYDFSKFESAIQASKIKDFIDNLPNGIDTNIGERGIKLSGGQIQRIGIARALYKNPELLILDESTNALDLNTETKLIEDITSLKNKCTIILISHKLSNLKKCDKLFKIENKKIIPMH